MAGVSAGYVAAPSTVVSKRNLSRQPRRRRRQGEVITCVVASTPSTSERVRLARDRLESLKRGEYNVSTIVRTSDGLVEVSEEIQARSAAYKSAEDRKRYDPEVSAERLKDRQVELWARRVKVASPLVAFVSKVVIDWQLGREKEMRPERAQEFMKLIANLGPAFIKGGQALSSRPDLLPPEYLEELQKLQDRLPPFPNELAYEQIEEELGMKLDDVFERLEPEPVAAASIGQVYKGVLKTGEAVAVKVQRPNCEDIIEKDIYILRRTSGTLNQLLRIIKKDVDLQKIVDEFGKLLYDEIDYLNEARNGDRFQELYGSAGDIVVPKVYWKYTSRKVLTTEWINGSRLDAAAPGSEKSELVRSLVQCSLRQMLENGYFHADPHGGNLLATDDGVLCYLDFGMMSTLTSQQSYGIILAIVHLVNRNWEALVRLYKRLGLLNESQDSEPIITALNEVLPDVLDASVGQFNFKSVIDKLGYVFYTFDFTLPPYYTAIFRCLGVLEGVAIQIDPEFKILNEAYPFVASRLLSDESLELRDALGVLLTKKDGTLEPGRWSGLLTSAARMSGNDVGVALRYFLNYILSEEATEIRYQLADLLVDEIDELGVDAMSFASGLVASNIGFGLPLVRSGGNQTSRGGGATDRPSVVRGPDPVASKKLQTVVRAASEAFSNRGIHIDNMGEIVQEFLSKAEGQRFAAEVSLGVAERFSSRSIRFVFRLPQLSKPQRLESLIPVEPDL